MTQEYDLLGHFPINSFDAMYVINFRVHKIELETDLGTRVFELNQN